MNLIQKLTNSKIDIIGDIHGEFEALNNLLHQLGYDDDGFHPDDRKLVFVGDFCDRGPDSPSVIKKIKKLIDLGNAQAIIGNHELNILKGKRNAGTGWFFEERQSKDISYEPYAKIHNDDKQLVLDFFNNLPVALENDDLRIVHAAWNDTSIKSLKDYSGKIGDIYIDIEKNVNEDLKVSGLLDNYNQEQSQWEKEIEDENFNIPFLHYTSLYNLNHQMNNPIRVLTSGVEVKAEKIFYASGKWRFIQRDTWWNNYTDDKPVIVGHYWRKLNPTIEDNENIFNNIQFNEWHGANKNVFCVDFSVGGRFKERNQNKTGENTNLVALRWPEKTLMFENGSIVNTINFKISTINHLNLKNISF